MRSVVVHLPSGVAVVEFGKVTGKVNLVDRVVRAVDRALQLAKEILSLVGGHFASHVLPKAV